MKAIKIQKILFYLVLLVMTFIYIGPFLFSLSISFNAEQDVFSWPIKLLPEKWTLGNYQRVWQDLPFGQWLFNSFIITLIQTVTNVFFASLAGFAFARLDFPGKNILFSILLGSLGLFGFILFTTERKFREIGLRKVLGANTAEVILLINKRFINMLFVAFSVAAPVAFALMSNWLSDFAYKIDQPIWVYMLTLAVTFFIATLTVSYSSWKAATSNPVEAIKVE